MKQYNRIVKLHVKGLVENDQRVAPDEKGDDTLQQTQNGSKFATRHRTFPHRKNV